MLPVLYLFHAVGHAERVDVSGEALRLTRQLTRATSEPEARGLLALMLLDRARQPARLDDAGNIITLEHQDTELWDTRQIAEAVRKLQTSLSAQTPDRPRAGLREVERIRDFIGDRHKWHAVRGYLLELDGDLPAAADAYAEAATRATVVAERDHLIRKAASARSSAP